MPHPHVLHITIAKNVARLLKVSTLKAQLRQHQILIGIVLLRVEDSRWFFKEIGVLKARGDDEGVDILIASGLYREDDTAKYVESLSASTGV